jgi:hypothetical protein
VRICFALLLSLFLASPFVAEAQQNIDDYYIHYSIRNAKGEYYTALQMRAGLEIEIREENANQNQEDCMGFGESPLGIFSFDYEWADFVKNNEHIFKEYMFLTGKTQQRHIVVKCKNEQMKLVFKNIPSSVGEIYVDSVQFSQGIYELDFHHIYSKVISFSKYGKTREFRNDFIILITSDQWQKIN